MLRNFALTLLLSSTATAQMSFVTQDRLLEVRSDAAGGGPSDHDEASVTAPDFGPFDEIRSVNSSAPHGAGAASARNQSLLGIDRVQAYGFGSTSASAAFESDASGGASANTHFVVEFDVVEPCSFTCTGTLRMAASTGSDSVISLQRGSTSVFYLQTASIGDTPILRGGVLTPGRYTLGAYENSSAAATMFWYWSGSASYDFQFQVERLSVPFCSGDGAGTACPCGNSSPAGADAGCLNSLGQGGTLRSSGTPSLSSDSFVLEGAGMTNSNALYFQGTTQVGAGNGAVFGDGKRCVAGSVVRLATRTNAGGASRYPVASEPAISVIGGVGAPGTRFYQALYRNTVPFCAADGFNLTNGLAVEWQP